MTSWAEWLPRQRWYAGGDRTISAVRNRAVLPLRDGAAVEALDVTYGDGSTDCYLVITPVDPVSGTDTGRLRLLLESVGLPAATLPPDAEMRVIGTEQSNTSAVVGERVMLKLFRRVSSGVNPDVELTGVLSRAGNPHVAPLLGAIEAAVDDRTWVLGMVSGYVAESRDGWTMATAGAITEHDAHRLGEAVASVHADLARALGTAPGVVPVEAMGERLRAAVAAVPGLAGYADRIGRRYAAVAGESVTVQRIHGDLHLGQVLRTPETWLLIDFEGEPGRPIAERRGPDSVLRDVAGMLRSFSYAGCAVGIGAAFCDGYAAGSGADPRERAGVLAAYEVDKAVYEAVYEARHRPDWLHIPMEYIAGLSG